MCILLSRPRTTRPLSCCQKIHADGPDSSIIDGIDDPIVLANISAVESIVSQIDLAVIEACYSNRGRDSYPADVLLRIALYSILDGRPSPNQWARLAQTCSAVRYLARRLRPSRATLHRFRDKSKNFIDDVFGQVLVLAQKKISLMAMKHPSTVLSSMHLLQGIDLSIKGHWINVRPKSQLRSKRIFKGPSRLIRIACQLGWQRLPAEDWNNNSVLSKPTTFSPRNLKEQQKAKI